MVVAASVLGCGSRNDLSTAADACDEIWFVGDKSGAVSVVLDETRASVRAVAIRLFGRVIVAHTFRGRLELPQILPAPPRGR